MKVMVSGSHGLIGTELVKSYQNDGHEVIRLSRDFKEANTFDGIDALIHLAGESIAEGRWSADKKKRIRDSRVLGTKRLCEMIAASSRKPKVLVSASAIGFYGDRGDKPLNEQSSLGQGFLPEVCKEWEDASQLENIRVARIRTGIVLSEKGGALKKMLTPFKMGAGGVLGSGRQYMSWISLDDMIGAIRFIVDNAEIDGAVNLTAPHPVTNKEFTKRLGSALKRPTIAPMPAFAARLLFGEMANALLLSGARVIPDKLTSAGYAFKHEQLENALKDVLS